MDSQISSMLGGSCFKLGLFAPNCSSGIAVTTVPERWDASWENNVALARMADEAGIEFMVPLARWKGYGGDSDFEASTLEAVTFACGLLASTSRITIFGTVHAPLVHPIFAAKQLVTAHHIGQGRLGLNLVCGWNQAEFDMFAIEQREHDTRYDYGQEWLDVVRRIWSSEGSFDYEGKFIKLTGVSGDPKPYGGVEPIIMNAGWSPAGRDFASRNCDFIFTIALNPRTGAGDVRRIKEAARVHGRDVRVATTSYVVCRPTRSEAEEYHRYYAEENADWDAVARLMELQGIEAAKTPKALYETLRRRAAGGHGMYPIIGDPDDVADQLGQLSEAGFVGTTIAFVNYLAELPYFRDEVMPRLVAAGLRLEN
jgi:FMNH2-dependent dimethyl sulfone monooxygenase